MLFLVSGLVEGEKRGNDVRDIFMLGKQMEPGFEYHPVLKEIYDTHNFVDKFASTFNLVVNEFLNKNLLSEIEYTSKADIKLYDKLNQTEVDLCHNDIVDAFLESVKNTQKILW